MTRLARRFRVWFRCFRRRDGMSSTRVLPAWIARGWILGPLLLVSSCGDESAPAVARLVASPSVWRAPLADHPEGRIRGELRVTLMRDVAAGATLLVDQGCIEDGRRYFGREVRYRLPDLQTDLLGAANEVMVQVGDERWSAFALAMDQGWFAVPFSRALEAGTELRVRLGDVELQEGGPWSGLVPLMLTLEVSLREGASTTALGAVPVIVQNPEVDWLRVIAPSQVAPGAGFELRVVCMNGFHGPTSNSMGTEAPRLEVEVWRDGHWQDDVLQPVAAAAPFAAYALTVSGLAPGVQRLRIRLSGSHPAEGISSPILCGEEGDPVRFGTLHNHTVMGGHASGTPRQALTYARHVSALDFCGLTEHAESPTFDWPWLVSLVDEASESGRFVAFAGLEWTHPRDGHRHLIYRDAAQVTPVSSASDPAVPGVRSAPDLETLAREIGHDGNVLCVVHHPTWRSAGVQDDYRLGAPELNPRQLFAEVYSWHGCALPSADAFPIHGDQRVVEVAQPDLFQALDAGHGFAFVADSDQHFGRPGSLLGVRWQRSLRYSFLGLIAATAPALDRATLWNAFEQGDVYGTTGARMLVHFEPDGVAPTLRVHATAPLAEVRAYVSGRMVGRRQYPAVAADLGTADAPLYVDPGRGVWDVAEAWPELEGRDRAVVFEVIQQDQHRAWMSRPAGR